MPRAHRYLPLRAFAVAITALLLLSRTAFGTVLFECRMSGQVGPRCCCSAKERKVSRTGEARFERRGCCTAQSIESDSAPASVSGDSTILAPCARSSTVIDAPEPANEPSPPSAVPARSRAPPNGWPPLFIKHRSLLS